MTLTPARLTAAGTLALLALTGAGYALIVAPLLRAAVPGPGPDGDADSAQQAALLDQEALALARAAAEAAQRAERLEVRLLPATAQNARLAALTRLAQEAGVEVLELAPGALRAEGSHDTLPVRIVARGGYQSSGAFLMRVRQELPDFAVVGFQLAGSPENPGAPADLRFDLEWHAAREARAGAGADTRP
jgi:hypothetical protein